MTNIGYFNNEGISTVDTMKIKNAVVAILNFLFSILLILKLIILQLVSNGFKKLQQ